MKMYWRVFAKEAIPASQTDEDSVLFPMENYFLGKENMAADIQTADSGVQRVQFSCWFISLDLKTKVLP